MHLRDTDPLSQPWGTKTHLILEAGGDRYPPARVELFVIRGARPGKVLLALAGVHGDEYEGPFALWKFVESLVPEDLTGTVLVLPVANWQAFQVGQRCAPTDSVNLNRVFPGEARGGYTESLGYDLFECLVRRSDMVIDLHSGGGISNFHPTSCFFPDSPQASMSLEACRSFGLPIIWSMAPTRGVMTTEAARAGAIAVGAEYGGENRLDPCGVQAYFEGMFRSLKFLGLLTGKVPLDMSLPVVEGEFITAQAQFGLFQVYASPGQPISKGDLLAAVTDPQGKICEKFEAPEDGLLLAVRPRPVIGRGDWAVCPVRLVSGKLERP